MKTYGPSRAGFLPFAKLSVLGNDLGVIRAQRSQWGLR